MKKLLLILLLILPLIAVNVKADYFDNFGDGSVNWSFWTNNSAGSTAYIESNGRMGMQVTTTTTSSIWAHNKLLPPYYYKYFNVTLSTSLSATAGNCVSYQIDIWGFTTAVFHRDRNGGGCVSGVNGGNWTGGYNFTRPNAFNDTFLVYQNGTFYRNITVDPTNMTYQQYISCIAGSVCVANITIDFDVYHAWNNITQPLTYSRNTSQQLFVNINSTSLLSFNLQNISLIVLDKQGNLFYTANQTLSTKAQTKTFNVTLSSYGNYTVYAMSCSNNATRLECFTGQNISYTYDPPYQLVYDTSIIEGSSGVFAINVSTTASMNSATLVYNNTNYTGSIITESSTQKYAYTTVTIPSVTSNTVKSFYWYVTFTDGSVLVSNVTNQTVLNALIDNCATGTDIIYNMTVVDEDTLGTLEGTAYNASISYYAYILVDPSTTILSSVNQTLSKVNSTNPAKICLSAGLRNTANLSMYLFTQYQANGYVPEHENFQNISLTPFINVTQLKLYDLSTSNANGQQFKLTYRDNNYIYINDVVIEIYRKYLGLAQNILVEAPSTGTDGSTTATFVLNDEVYTLVVKKNNQVLATFSNYQVTCQSGTSCEINLKQALASSSIGPINFFNNVSLSPEFNTITKVFTISFTAKDLANHQIAVNATIINRTLNQVDYQQQICYDSANGAIGSVSCTLSGNQVVRLRVFIDGLLAEQYYQNPYVYDNSTYGTTRLLFAVGLIVTLVFMSAGNKVFMLLFLFVGAIASGSLYLFDNGGIFSTTSIAMWLAIVTGILIWRFRSN